ncbi:MAG: thiamine phosphate synthase [Candidatus Acidulodesulfobacterium sp.]
MMIADTSRFNFNIYLIGDKNFFNNDGEYIDALDEAFGAGLKAFQLRQKDVSIYDFIKIGEKIRSLIFKKYPDVNFFINERADVAAVLSADGVHLNINALPIKSVKEKFKNLKIFYSSHSVEDAVNAEKNGADFVTFSPVYKTKKQVFFHGADALKKTVNAVKIPVFALGGINEFNIPEIKESGCRFIAVQSALLSLNGKDIGKEVKKMINILNKK